MTAQIQGPTATLNWPEAQQSTWDSIVIGAGPAGAIAARQLALRGLQVLLVDRAEFPRWKVCGCCVNLAAIRLLNELGISRLDREFQIQPLTRFQLASRGRQADVPMVGGFAISRSAFDSRLIAAAIDAGTQFLDNTKAQIQPAIGGTTVSLQRKNERQEIACRIAIIAAGLGDHWLRKDEQASVQAESRIARHSRIGAGATFPAYAGNHADQTVHMACDRRGYVGVVRLENGELDVAAALDPTAIRSTGGIGPLIGEILASAGLPPIDGLNDHAWKGTQRLTRHRHQVWGKNHFLIGDAAGYVEPFTGEGMAWAMATGRAVAPLAARAIRGSAVDAGKEWQRQYRQLMNFRQRKCRAVSLLLRRPALVNLAVWALARKPRLAKRLEDSLNRPFPQPVSESTF